MTEKKFTGWLVLDYKSGNMKVSKRKPKLSKASEIAILLDLDVEIPEQPILKAEGKIILSSTQLKNMMIEALTDASEEIK